ncbi:MAG: chromosome segregation protein SMC, partial [Pseudomonadota bacterium]
MRLKQIKLAGFKSFVDPTTVNFPSNRAAVVGPNGCGKSNIIDAVRWVMGESSAKQLRGENLTDVIFNGSGSRQPTAQASIELIFDNSDGRIGGEYAAYAEIGIRRQVTREAQSTYFLNGQKCRRRDILDIFLGTGFGPRSYSIIEQGMISQLVEAKPDELRVYLEEAAGISKYKERRRETENRIRHTRDNLARINDIREELGKQLERLDRQARAAERYQQLKADERRLTAELMHLRLAAVNDSLAETEGQVRAAEVELERTQSERSRLVADTETQRREHADHSDRFNAVQGHFYKLGADIARLEEAIAFNAERVQQLELDLATVAERLAEAEQQTKDDAGQIQQFEQDLETLRPALDRALAESTSQATDLEGLETRFADWQRGWDSFTAELAQAERTTSVAAARIEYLEQLIGRLNDRQGSLNRDAESLPQADTAVVDSLAAAIADQDRGVRQAEAVVDETLRALASNREAVASAESGLENERNRVQALRRDLAALQARQQAALGKDDQAAQAWVDAQGLAHAPRLGEHLAVVSGWERAVECVLQPYLQAIEVAELDRYASGLASLDAGNVALLDRERTEATESPRDAIGLPLLSSLVRQGSTESGNRLAIGTLLAGVYAASSLDVALTARSRLLPGESLVTREGLWLGSDWARGGVAGEAEQGIIQLGLDIEPTGSPPGQARHWYA